MEKSIHALRGLKRGWILPLLPKAIGHLPHCTLQQHHVGCGGPKNGPKGTRQYLQILQPDHLLGHRWIFFSCFGPATPQELWAEPISSGKAFPPPPRLRKHCRQTQPTSFPSLFLSEGNDLQWTLWGHRPQQTLINCVIYCLTRLCVDPSHGPV